MRLSMDLGLGSVVTLNQGGWGVLVARSLEIWDTSRADLLTVSGGLASSFHGILHGYDLTASGVTRPGYGAGVFGGLSGLTFDGTQYMSLVPSPFPTGAAEYSIWAVVQQDAPASSTGVRNFFAIGGTTQLSRRLQRTVVSGVNRAKGVVGNGGSFVEAIATTVDFSARHVMRLKVTATKEYLYIDGVLVAEADVVPATDGTRVRLGANSATTPGEFGLGMVNLIAVTTGETDAEAAIISRTLGQRATYGDTIFLAPNAVAGLDTSLVIANAFNNTSQVSLLDGQHNASLQTSVPDNKKLTGTADAILKLLSTSNATAVVDVGNNCEVSGFKINANITARKVAGFTSGTHGVRSSNKTGAKIHDMHIAGHGHTDPVVGEGYICAVLIEREIDAVADVTDVEVYNNYFDDAENISAFHVRVRTNFQGDEQPGQQGFRLIDAKVYDNVMVGSIKNAIELVGPDTSGHVYGNQVIKPAGQGGCEVDFGASQPGYISIIEENIIEQVGLNGTQQISFDAVSARAGKQQDGSVGVRPIGAIIRNNVLKDSVQQGTNFMRLQADFGSQGTQWAGNSIQNVTKSVGATSPRLIGYGISAELEPVTGVLVDGLDADSADELVRITNSTFGFSDLVFRLSSAQITRVLIETPALSGQTFEAVP